jgi:hypothetical protein
VEYNFFQLTMDGLQIGAMLIWQFGGWIGFENGGITWWVEARA